MLFDKQGISCKIPGITLLYEMKNMFEGKTHNNFFRKNKKIYFRLKSIHQKIFFKEILNFFNIDC